MIHTLSNSPKSARVLFAAQFKATPPAYTRFLFPNPAYLLALCHKSDRHSSVTAWILAAKSMTSASGCQSPIPLCTLRLSLNGCLTTKSLYMSSLYLGVPYALMPIKIYSSSAGFSPHRCVNAEYNIPTLLGYLTCSILSIAFWLYPFDIEIVSHSPIASTVKITASLKPEVKYPAEAWLS